MQNFIKNPSHADIWFRPLNSNIYILHILNVLKYRRVQPSAIVCCILFCSDNVVVHNCRQRPTYHVLNGYTKLSLVI